MRALAVLRDGCRAGLECAWPRPFPVDDSLSQVLDTNVRMQWESVAPGRGRSAMSSGRPRYRAPRRIAVAGTQRTHFHAAAGPAGRLRSRRVDHAGPLQPGMLRSGERALVFAGPVRPNCIEDTLVIRITTDGERLERDESLEFSFEIEVD
jgi:hypothetical protein